MRISRCSEYYSYGNMLNLDREWVESQKDDIIEFSGLGDFINRPIRTYSSGMTLRLSFSLFTCLDPDILIIDEALAVGDSSFQLKCMRRIENMIHVHKKSVILVTHDMNALEKFSNRVLWLDEGKVKLIGDSRDVITKYIMQNSVKTKIAPPPHADNPRTLSSFNSVKQRCYIVLKLLKSPTYVLKV